LTFHLGKNADRLKVLRRDSAPLIGAQRCICSGKWTSEGVYQSTVSPPVAREGLLD
jgi:hypothetical protein